MVSIVTKSSNTVPLSSIHIGDFFCYANNIFLKTEGAILIVAHGAQITTTTPELGVDVNIFTNNTPVYLVETIFNVIK